MIVPDTDTRGVSADLKNNGATTDLTVFDVLFVDFLTVYQYG